MSLIHFAYFIFGLALLIAGAELLVRGASRLAAAFGISPLVIGLTVVAFGTSSPELAISVQSGLAGQSDIALGNVVGSNIFNVLFILGLSAVITPLLVAQQLVRLDVPVMIGVSLLVLGLGLDGAFSRPEGGLLVAGLAAYTAFLIRQSRRESQAVQTEYAQEFGAATSAGRGRLLNLALVAGGLGLLVLGSRWLVTGAVAFAQALGVSELVIGLTLVAAGTSMPEVATSLIAAVRGQRDIAVGNVVGSNIFNLLGVLGLTAVVAPNGVPVSDAVLGFDLPVMIAVAVACLPIFLSSHLIARWEGFVFLGYYAAYTTYLILESAQHDALPLFSTVMGAFVLPLTAITLLLVLLRAWRAQRRG
ncbi:calcium/sodium antiporter [Thermithiobacillus tepidarius DSM 3134]|uniref:calcium/sodium antiporter n=1 Tax=Thermithiobacillus tepidarius TaxID=929 RepID=UPI00040DC300|nr:calcium/sodium antiporter [Thermithiobacillus tepidarius]